ncbi:MAG: sodium-dependent transporter [Clostridia bacterium]|nr:sodium-dependent transporter [Clostridia bacterium]
MDNEKKVPVFASRFGYIMVAAGAAIGLGNIWRFPYLAYRNGGAIFILIYVAIVFVVGKAGIEMESALGRYTRTNPVAAYGKIHPRFKFIGGIGVLFTFMLDMYYVVVGGYVLKYAVDYLIGADFGGDSTLWYDSFVSHPIMPVVYTLILLLVVVSVLLAGITEKVEKVQKIIMPMLFVILIVCGIGMLVVSPNAMMGLKYYLVPDFSKLTLKTFSDACVQVMFSIGTGWTLYLTLGANVSKDNNIRKDANYIILCDTLVAILAGFVVIPPIVGTGSEMVAGPSLVFVALTDVFAVLPGGRILGFLFFIVLFLAVISSMFTFIEIPAVVVKEKLNVSHAKATVITTIAVFLFSLLCAWSQGDGILSFVRIPWINVDGISWYRIIDWVDCFSSYVLMPVGNVLVAFFCAKIWKFSNYERELTVGGRDGKLRWIDKAVITVLIPIFSIIVLMNVFGILG